ncbi:transcobalamin-2 [Nelusetta ayraudi]|uniref:transcobalamin-2 n=1 Tax=Nelusetta ayraudi TaxID=303726 RepID=UPI003F70DA1C
MLSLLLITLLLAFASGKQCETEESHDELILSLSKNLLRSLETPEGTPNPSVHLALRLSNSHNQAKELIHLNRLKNDLHNDIQSSLSNSQPVTGILALYTLALKSSCYDPSTVTFTVGENTVSLLTQLKTEMELEKEHISFSRRPLTNYYQHSLGVLALCVSGVRVNNHVTHKLIRAVEHELFRHGDSESVDTYAMAGMALQCVKDYGSHVHNTVELGTALCTIKQKLLDFRRPDGHIGNEFSTGLAVQALLALGSPVESCDASMEAMRTGIRSGTYHNPMASSQILPALQQKSYLAVKNKDCLNEDDSIVLEPIEPVVTQPSQTELPLTVEVVMSSMATARYPVVVPMDSTLLETLQILQKQNLGFTFETETSLWGPSVSAVNGEQARQSDRRYWHLSADGTALIEGVGDYRIKRTQAIKIENTAY